MPIIGKVYQSKFKLL